MATSTDIPGAPLKDRITGLLASASIELTPHDEEHLPALQAILPPGTSVYIAHPPHSTLHDVVHAARTVQAAGFAACPHIVARRLRGPGDLRAALDDLHQAGIDRILLVAGDLGVPLGPFESSLAVLQSGITVDCGIHKIGVAGHPEGNRVIGTAPLWTALAGKQAFAESTGSQIYIVTQFSFDPEAIMDWARQLRGHGITLPVHLGLAGPAPLRKLIRYAMMCGIGASLRALTMRAGGLSTLHKMVTATDEMVVALARLCPDAGRTPFAQLHLFSFGGCVATAQWMRALGEGNFKLRGDGTGIELAGT